MAVGQAVSTQVGCPVTIVLTAAGRTVEPLEFLIRQQPQLGTLGEVRRIGGNKASVIYTPRSKIHVGSDSFTFAVQSFDSPVSAAARIWVKIVEVPPAFECPHELDFGEVLLGKKAVLPLLLENTGGGVVSGLVEADSPWSITGPTGYQLIGGAKASIPIGFAPADERDYVGTLRVGGDPKAFVAVRGRGVAPIKVSPEVNVIDSERREGRGFSLVLTNLTPEPRSVAIDCPDFIKAPGEILLPAGGNQTVNAQIAPDFLLGFNGTVKFQSEGFVGRIMLQMSSFPATLELVSGNELNFGLIKNGRSAHGRFTVKNTGGTDTRLRMTMPRELDVSPDPANLILSPSKDQTFDVQLEASKGEAYFGTIDIKGDSGKVLELAVRASFPRLEVPAGGNSVAQPVAKFLKFSSAPSGQSQADLPLPGGSGPAVETVSLLLSTPHEIEISWQKLPPDIASYRIERRRVAGINSALSVDWVPWPEARISTLDGSVHVRFENMMSNTTWTFRIVAMDSSGAARSRSLPFQMATQPPSPQWAFLWWLLGAVILGVAAWIVRAWRREQRRLMETDNARIARIGK